MVIILLVRDGDNIQALRVLSAAVVLDNVYVYSKCHVMSYHV
jgi:hypothetical protein